MVRLQQRLERRLRRKIHLTITDNRVVMFSFRRDGRRLRVRLHHMFLDAEGAVLAALVKYIRTRQPESRVVIREFVDENRHQIRRKGQRRRKDPGGLARGEVYDLNEIYDRLNADYFGNRVRAQITWGQHFNRRRTQSIKLGTYIEQDRRIVISPTLDRRSVPYYVVEWVVYHEMLHDLLGFKVVNGISYAHTPEFRQKERNYAFYKRASAWEERNLDKLLAA